MIDNMDSTYNDDLYISITVTRRRPELDLTPVKDNRPKLSE